MTETDYEKLRRELREMEGKNISHYSVLLTAYIRTRVENMRMIAILSAAGIALLAMIFVVVRVHGPWKLLFMAGAFLGFLTSLWASLVALEENTEKLKLSLKDGPGQDLNLDGSSGIAKGFLLFACICLIALGLSSVWAPVFQKTCCLGKKTAMAGHQATHDTSGAEMSTTMKTGSETMSTSVVSEDTAMKTTAIGNVSQETSKKSGNAGIFPRGVSK